MKKILWLTTWYPNRGDRFDGDFIQRQARAVSSFCQVQVIHVVKENEQTKGVGKEEKITGNLREQVLYYSSPRTGFKLLDKILSHRKYMLTCKKAVGSYISRFGKPDRVHVHVTFRAGPVALWIKKNWNIPFVVTEHWTGFLPEAESGIDALTPIQRIWIQKVLQNANRVTVVSQNLGDAMKVRFPFLHFSVIPNVVDCGIFHVAKKEEASGTIRFIHVSNMNYQKNAEDILQSFRLLKDTHPGFIAEFYGPVRQALKNLISEYGLEGKVFLRGEVQQEELARSMQRSAALILYSRYETFGCVIIEANACGIPVIASELKVLHELVTEQVNGSFVTGEAPQRLYEKLREFMNGELTFDRLSIANAASAKYNFETVGRMICSLYED